jgi:hypothetical protein
VRSYSFSPNTLPMASESNELSLSSKILSHRTRQNPKPARRRKAAPVVRGGDVPLVGATRRDGATCQACAPLSSFNVAEARTIAQGPHVASADNPAKWLRPLFRQIHFRKACARVDHRACLADDTRQRRLESSQELFPTFLTLVRLLDAFEGSQLLRVCRGRLRP